MVALVLLPLGVLNAEPSAPVSFRAEIAPLLHRRCATCHSEENAKGKYRLDTFAELQKPGQSELAALQPGAPEESELYRLLIEPVAKDRMPQKADPLPPEEIATIGRWIKEGAHYDGGAAERPLVELARETLLRPAPERYARPAAVTALAFSPDGAQLALSGYYEVLLWSLEEAAVVRRIGGLPERINAVAWQPQQNLIAIAGGSPSQWGAVALIEPDENFRVRYLCDLADNVLSVAFSPDGALLAAGCADRTIRFFEVASGKMTRVLRAHADWVQCVAFSPDGQWLVSASRDRTARVVKVSTGEVESTYAEHDAPLLGVVFTGGSRVATFTAKKAAHLWEISGTKRRAAISDFPWPLQSLVTWRDLVITGSTNPAIEVRQFSDRWPLQTLFGHRDAVQSLALSPNREVLASGSADGEVLLWDLACGTWTQRFTASPVRQP